MEAGAMLKQVLQQELPRYLSDDEGEQLGRLLVAESAGSPRQSTQKMTAFLTTPISEMHRIPSHPETFERTQVIRERVLKEFPDISVVSEIPHVTREQLVRFHTPKYVDWMLGLFDRVQASHQVSATPGSSTYIDIDDDTSVMEGTEDAALTAAGAVCHAIDLVMESTTSGYVNAFCGVRPPGHHAEPHRAMGFCFFNNIGVGACHLLHKYPDKIKKVLILDFDVHHGNGTQAKFDQDHPEICFISTHQRRFYPHTGKASERGSHNNIMNVPLVARSPSRVYRQIFEERIVPMMRAFEPDFILISAGFDAHRLDPLADISLESSDYYWITKHVVEVAWKHAEGRIVSSLEGGYHLEALAESAAAHVRALVEGSHRDRTLDDTTIDQLAAAFDTGVKLETTEDLRVTVHYNRVEKLVILKSRSLEALLQQCKNKFTLKKKAKTVSLVDAHGTAVTDTLLRSLPSDQHLYLR
ncbi:hypothetical protein Poli38472_008265 [Pythium oligandrum]|uniref:Histone deacetylase domain-containing protein n=1 Tax=Pythium oligandrum TaxID=41045 RepID=A0A8K1FPH1_PYTOL|nr:hypothetical protein Poli38472_008265 [Pythium oligandrum]|eukprot:TMW65623.1 hypothetical protein Poli38472_008265 [Pythium oligandrum]